MKTRRATFFKALLAIVPALLLALVLQPAAALAEDNTHTITYQWGSGHSQAGVGAEFLDATSSMPLSEPRETVVDGASPQFMDYYAFSNPQEFRVKLTDGYYFAYWTANADVTLNDGNVTTTVKSGAPLTTTQVKQIVVEQDLTLTAYTLAMANYSTFYFTSDERGIVSAQSEDVYMPARLGNMVPTAQPRGGYTFAYWTASAPVFIFNDTTSFDPTEANGEWVSAGTHISDDELSRATIRENVTVTANFEAPGHTITYKVDANIGSLPAGYSPTVSVEDGKCPTNVPTPVANDSNQFVFDYWTADVPVQFIGSPTTYPAGTHFASSAVALIVVENDITFEAHFKSVPYTITYEADEHGSFTDGSKTTETVQYGSTPANVPATSPDMGYELHCWTANVEVELLDGTKVPLGSSLTPEELLQVKVTKDVTFTVDFIQVAALVSYTTDGNGSVNPTSELVTLYESPEGAKPTPKSGYAFDYWTANVEVFIPDGDEDVLAQFDPGDPISDEELKQIAVTSEVTFTAHFKQTSDGSDTIKPADGTSGKLTPKTADTLPGATAAVALGAGAVVAGAALLKKRSQ